jgi:hypothetical protein
MKRVSAEAACEIPHKRFRGDVVNVAASAMTTRAAACSRLRSFRNTQGRSGSGWSPGKRPTVSPLNERAVGQPLDRTASETGIAMRIRLTGNLLAGVIRQPEECV